jgi:hypothetical protein
MALGGRRLTKRIGCYGDGSGAEVTGSILAVFSHHQLHGDSLLRARVTEKVDPSLVDRHVSATILNSPGSGS